MVQDRIPQWFHRQALEVLTEVSATELGDLAELLRFVVISACENATMVVVKAEPYHRDRAATMESWWLLDDGPHGQHAKAEKLASAYHLFGIVRRAGLSDLPPAPFAGIVGTANAAAICFDVAIARSLLAIVAPED